METRRIDFFLKQVLVWHQFLNDSLSTWFPRGVFLQFAVMDPVSLPRYLDSCGHHRDDGEGCLTPGLQAW